MSFLIQVEVFLVLCMITDFLLKPRHFRYYIMRHWILFKLCFSRPHLTLHQQGKGPQPCFCPIEVESRFSTWFLLTLTEERGISLPLGMDGSSCSPLELCDTIMAETSKIVIWYTERKVVYVCLSIYLCGWLYLCAYKCMCTLTYTDKCILNYI